MGKCSQMESPSAARARGYAEMPGGSSIFLDRKTRPLETGPGKLLVKNQVMGRNGQLPRNRKIDGVARICAFRDGRGRLGRIPAESAEQRARRCAEQRARRGAEQRAPWARASRALTCCVIMLRRRRDHERPLAAFRLCSAKANGER